MDYTHRIQQVKKLLSDEKLDAALISSVPNIIYLTGFSGFSSEEREAYLLITKTHNYIFTDARYSEAVITQIPHFTLKEITGKTPISKLLKEIITKEKIIEVGIEEQNITITESKILSSCIRTQRHITLSSLRQIKDREEIEMIQNSCALGDKAFEYILSEITEGISEKELALKLEIFIKGKGAELSFRTIVAFGTHSSVPHHETSDTKLTKNSIVLLDFGVKKDHYCSDMTRTVFFGTATAEFKKMYETVRIAQQNAIDLLAMKDIHKGSEIDAAARDYIISKGYPSIPHSVGHGTGIEVHEEPRLSPNSDETLTNGMVFSVEPGIYIPGVGGVRIEDLVAIQDNTVTVLSKSPKNLIEL